MVQFFLAVQCCTKTVFVVNTIVNKRNNRSIKLVLFNFESRHVEVCGFLDHLGELLTAVVYGILQCFQTDIHIKIYFRMLWQAYSEALWKVWIKEKFQLHRIVLYLFVRHWAFANTSAALCKNSLVHFKSQITMDDSMAVESLVFTVS
jgi:hypothetical protein